MAESKSYLKLSGITGDSTDANHRGWIEVSSVSIARADRAYGGEASGGNGNPPTESSFVGTLGKQSALLSSAAATGKNIPSAVLERFRPVNGKQVLYLRVTYTNVVVVSYQFSGTQESYVFNYEKMQFTAGSAAQLKNEKPHAARQSAGKK